MGLCLPTSSLCLCPSFPLPLTATAIAITEGEERVTHWWDSTKTTKKDKDIVRVFIIHTQRSVPEPMRR